MPVSDQGVSQDRYQLIPRTLIFIIRGESVLLLRGAAHKRLWANRYNGVGGHIEQGEDVLSAARRELKEETGLSANELHLVGTVLVDTGQPTGIGLYVIRGISNQGEPRPSEEGHLEWVPFSKITQKDLVDDLPILLPRVLEHDRGEGPFSARYYYDDTDQLKIEFSH